MLLASWEVFQLTTVSQDIPGMVSAATELLLTRIAAERRAAAATPRGADAEDGAPRNARTAGGCLTEGAGRC